MSRKIVWLWVMVCVLLLAACGGGEEQGQTSDGHEIEPLIGVDTTRPLITPEDEAAMAKRLLIPYKENGLWGYTDSSGTVVIPAKYEQAGPFLDGGLTVVKTGTGFGLLNKHGEEVVKPVIADRIMDCGCGVYGFKQTNGFALVNKLGKRIDRGQVQEVLSDCHEDRLAVKIDGKWGYVDAKGQPQIEADMEQVFPFYHGVAPVRKVGQKMWMLIGRDGEPVGTGRFETMYPFTDGLGVGIQPDAYGRSKYGVVDSLGNTIIPFQFARIAGTFTSDYVACAAYSPYELESKGIGEEANTWFIYNRKGKKVGESHYTLWDEFAEGLIVAESKQRFGFIDTAGTVVIPFKYDWACAFHDGLAWVGRDSLYGFIDRTGKEIIPLKYASDYDYVFMEAHGAPVVDPETGEHFYIDRNGKEYRKRP